MTNTIAFSILNRNGLDDTITCIRSLLASDYHDFHIYLLDNGSQSPDEFLQLQQEFKKSSQITVKRFEKNLGFTGGNNYNLRLMKKYDYLCLLNNDCIVQPGFLSDIMLKLEQQKRPGIYGPIICNSDGTIQSCGSMINLWTGSNPRLTQITGDFQEVDCVSGSCFIISQEVLQEVGLLDDQYFAYREESDYCLRAKKLGYPIIVLSSDGIVHKEETAHNKKKPYYTYLMFRNRVLFLKKHTSMIQYIVSWVVLLGYIIIVFPRVFGWRNYRYMSQSLRDGMRGKGGPM